MQPPEGRKKQMRYFPHFIAFVIILLMFVGAAAQSFYPATDPARYQCYALTFWSGSNGVAQLPHVQCTFLAITHSQPPFHMLPREYPPFTLLPFSLPLLFPFVNYQIAFSFLMMLALLLIYYLLIRFNGNQSAYACIFYTAIGAGALVFMRFDILPALATMLCLLTARYRRWSLAYLALAIGVLLKIYPLLLLPSLFIAEQQSKGNLPPFSSAPVHKLPQYFITSIRNLFKCSWYNTFFFFIILLVITGLFAICDVNNALVSQFSYFLQRPVQIESLCATLLWIAHNGGLSWKIAYDFGSINLHTTLNGSLSSFFSILLLLGVAYTLWQQWQQRYDFQQATVALLLIFVATGKVFSPQYLIWLILLLALVGYYTRPWLYLWGAISLLTTLIYVVFYSQILNPQHIVIPSGFFATAALRNAILAYLTIAYFFNWHNLRTTIKTNQ